jgi:hypothetical protein
VKLHLEITAKATSSLSRRIPLAGHESYLISTLDGIVSPQSLLAAEDRRGNIKDTSIIRGEKLDIPQNKESQRRKSIFLSE